MKTILAALFFVGLFSVDAAHAQSFSTPFQAGSHATATLLGNSSYACYVLGSGDYELSLTVTGPSNETISAINPAVDEKARQSVLRSAVSFGDTTLVNNLISFNTTKGAAGYGDYTITMRAIGAMSANPSIICSPTSVVCSFNTFNSDSVYLELTNTGSKSAPVSYFAIDYAGNIVESSVQVPAGIRNDVALFPLLGGSKYGSIVLRPQVSAPVFGEGIHARVSQYRNGVLQNIEICSPPTSNVGVI